MIAARTSGGATPAPDTAIRPALGRKVLVSAVFVLALLAVPLLVFGAMIASAPFFGTQPSEGQLAQSRSYLTGAFAVAVVAAAGAWALCFSIWRRDRYITGGVLSGILTAVALLLLPAMLTFGAPSTAAPGAAGPGSTEPGAAEPTAACPDREGVDEAALGCAPYDPDAAMAENERYRDRVELDPEVRTRLEAFLEPARQVLTALPLPPTAAAVEDALRSVGAESVQTTGGDAGIGFGAWMGEGCLVGGISAGGEVAQLEVGGPILDGGCLAMSGH